MRWFFALNEASSTFWDYANLVQVAVHSARTHTSLQPACLYDGTDNALTTWLEDAEVVIVRRRTFLHEWVTDLSPIARGAYLRLEIPTVCAERNWADEFVLYTDCDVVFRQDPALLLEPLQPQFFAAAPESDPTDFANFNSGVMWINVRAWQRESPALRQTIHDHLPEAISPPYDQAVLQRHFQDRVSPLPRELNWKPYWGEPDHAAIIHFHGPKPVQKYLALNRRLPASLAKLAVPAYFAACRNWDQLLIEALEATPWPQTNPRGIRDGFDSVARVVSGLGDPEGPHPEQNLPTVHWGLAPATQLEFEDEEGALRFEAVFQCPTNDQAVAVFFDDRRLAHLALVRANDPFSLSLDLPPAGPGRHRLSLQYAKSISPPAPDPRKLGVMFRALRIRRT